MEIIIGKVTCYFQSQIYLPYSIPPYNILTWLEKDFQMEKHFEWIKALYLSINL